MDTFIRKKKIALGARVLSSLTKGLHRVLRHRDEWRPKVERRLTMANSPMRVDKALFYAKTVTTVIGHIGDEDNTPQTLAEGNR